MLGPESLYQLPLLRRQLGANGQQKTGIRLFQLGPRLRNLVNLRKYFLFVRLVIAHQRLQSQFGLLKTCP